jgi:hypothetical protein
VPDRQVFRQIHRYGGGEVDMSRWPATVPAVAQILAEGRVARLTGGAAPSGGLSQWARWPLVYKMNLVGPEDVAGEANWLLPVIGGSGNDEYGHDGSRSKESGLDRVGHARGDAVGVAHDFVV